LKSPIRGLLRAFTLVTSPPLLDELEDKLRAKFGVSPGDAAAIRVKLEVPPTWLIPSWCSTGEKRPVG
jgi:hypothetical protein